MQDESKGNYDMMYHSMAKSKGSSAADESILQQSISRQSSLLQNNGNKTRVFESISDRTLKVAWNPKNHCLAFGGDKEVGYLWN